MKYMASKGWDSTRPAPGTFKIYPHGNGSSQVATPPSDTSNTEDAAAEIARLKAQVEALKANNSSDTDASAMAAQIEGNILNAISEHLSELADDEP